MKLTILVLLLGLTSLSASTYSQKTKLSLDLKNISLIEVLKAIESQSKFVFIYENEALRLSKKVSITVNKSSIDQILSEVLKNTGTDFEIIDKQIIITKKPIVNTFLNLKPKFETELQQPQKRVISGLVLDSKGQSLPGASVVVKGTTSGQITDSQGKFILSVPIETKILVISFIGMKSQEIAITGTSNIEVTLQDEMVVMKDEVIIVGYGVQKKQSIVGAISQVTDEQLKRSGNGTDLKQALTGQLPGLTTITSSGEPGGTGRGESATSIFIRGQNTWNGGQALILVDGVERDMSNIDVNEVENISILKDASATAVFGVKGANGVVLITTKRGIKGKPKLSFSYNITTKTLSKLPKRMDSYNAIMVRNESIEREVVLNEPSWAEYIPYELATRYKLPQTPQYAEIYPNVDWQKATFKDFSLSHHATLSVQGGTDFVTYFSSFSYLHEGDMFRKYENNKDYDPNYNFDRLNFRSNVDFKLTKTTNLKVNLSGYYSKKNTNYINEGTSASADYYMWAGIYTLAPDSYIPQYSDGTFGWNTYTKRPDPVAVVNNLGIRETRATQLNSDFTLEQDLNFITKGLSAKASFFYDNTILSEGGIYDAANNVMITANTPEKNINSDLYIGPDQNPNEYTTYYPTLESGTKFDWVITPWYIRPEVVSSTSYSSVIPITRRMVYQFQTNYDRKFGLHNIGVLGLVKREEYANGSMFKNYREDWVFRTTYDYATRYLFEMNGAYNGSEQFGPGYRFAFFPSVALGWYVSNEKFFKVKWINKLKLRFSSGMVGDDNVSGGRWLYDSQYSYGGTSVLNQNPNGTSAYTWYKESIVGNPAIHWEKALKNNFGIEMGLFNMLSINYDYYTEDRTDILLTGSSRNIPPYFGTTPPSANLGHVKSSGHEIELKFNKMMTNGFHYWATLNLTHTQNKILFKDDPQLLPSYLQQKGYPIGQTRSLISTGFYNNWDEVYASVPMETNDLAKLPGYYNILDYNADGIIKSSGDNAPIKFSSIPQNTYNMSLGVDYKGFSFMVQLYGVNNVSRNLPLANFDYKSNIVFDFVSDYWSKDNQNATSFLPRWRTQGQNIGDYFIYDASYLRLKTAEIAYTFKDNWLKKAGLSTFRIFLNGENLWLWSDLPDDREASFSGGTDRAGTYPTVKRITVGVDFTF